MKPFVQDSGMKCGVVIGQNKKVHRQIEIFLFMINKKDG